MKKRVLGRWIVVLSLLSPLVWWAGASMGEAATGKGGDALVRSKDQAAITPDDIAVLRAILSSGCGRTDGRYSVVSDMPVSAPDYAPAPAWPSVSLWAKLVARVPSGVRLPHLRICAADRIVDGTKVDSIFSRQTLDPPTWGPFYAEFPGAKGLLRISLPAFTPDKGHAIVYLNSTCGPLCGAGFYIELTRRKGGWKISRRETAWIS